MIAGVVAHDGTGVAGTYRGGKLPGFDESTCRTLALEVGLQNSGLAAALVHRTKHMVHHLSGSVHRS